MKIPSTLITLIFIITTSVIYADRAIIPNDVYNSYTQFLHNRPALNITDFSGEHTRRDVVEAIIWQQALEKGGYNKPINIEGLDVSYSRVMLELKHGTIHAFANSVWLEDTKGYEDSFYISDTLIPENKFYAGFYATSDRVREIEIKDKESLSSYKFSCNRHWTKDNQLLDHLKADCMFSNTWKTMIEKLRDKHADIVLAPFQANEDMSLIAYRFKVATCFKYKNQPPWKTCIYRI